MKILIFGANGWIGGQFIKELESKNISYVKGTCRVDDVTHLTTEIEDIQPTHIISFIGRTHGKIGDQVYPTIDYLENEGKLVDNIRDNLYSPLQLAILCKEKGIHFTYLGTGCIFEYDSDHPYGKEVSGFDERSEPNFFGSSYSIVKGFTDRLMHLYNDTVLNLRIRMPINETNSHRNFITKIINYEKICSIPNSMTVLPTLLPYVVDMMKNKTVGTMNLTNPGLISHNEILELYKKMVDSSFTWENFGIEEQNRILASGRSNNYLDTSRLKSLYPEVPDIKKSVIECLKKYPKPDCFTEKSTFLITGGCGFIGSNFINHIMDTYCKINIINIDAMYYCADETNIKECHRESNRYKLVKGNICSHDLLQYIFTNHTIDYVMHFAAQSHVQNSFNDSFQFTKDNIVGTHHLLEQTRIYGKVKKFIHVSTDEVYGESATSIQEQKKTEHSILCPTNPYAATKAGAELIAQSYIHSYKMPVIITRGNNVYGPNQYPEKVIPKFINQLKNNEKITIQGDGSMIRGFLHAKDTAKAFECIIKDGIIGEIYNIGCDENMEYTIMDIAKLLIKQIKKTDQYKEWIEFIDDRPFNDKRYYISNQKLKDLGWSIDIQFKDGITELINT